MEDKQELLLMSFSFLCCSYLYEILLEIFFMKEMMSIEKVIGEDHWAIIQRL